MIELLIGVFIFAAGLVVGWVFLPEPAFVRRFFERIGWARE
jgi:type II secretory pathway component PulJ